MGKKLSKLEFYHPLNPLLFSCRVDRKRNNDSTKQPEVKQLQHGPTHREREREKDSRVMWQQHANSAGAAHQHSDSKRNPGDTTRKRMVKWRKWRNGGMDG